MTLPFIHLRTHSEYSMVDGIVRIKDYVERALELKMPALALTDFVNLFALVKFYKKATAAGLKPIIGADILLLVDDEITHCTLLCKNQKGYHNLTEVLSRAYVEGQQNNQPIIHWDWLVIAAEGLIVLSGGQQGDIGRALLQKDSEKAQKCLARWQAVFPDHFYMELVRTQKSEQEDYIHHSLELALKFSVPVVATNDVRFIKAQDFEAHEARVCIHDGYVLDNTKRPRNYTNQQYLKTTEEMIELFADIPEAIANTLEIAKRCSVTISLGEVFLPIFPTPLGESVDAYFEAQAQSGLNNRLTKLKITEPKAIKPYQARLDRELNVIIEMGFPGYFLIVADFIAWAKQQKIPVGPGRGSGAGSVIAYALGITELDPLQHELLFERFLNPERVSMPDFDIDFCMEGRDRVIEYVAARYGLDAVAQIITYGTMAAKAVVRDVGRVLGLPYGFVDKIAKLIPFELGITLQKALDQEENLASRYQSEPEVQALINLAMKLEGITRNAGKHAGGVVIAPTKLTDFVPLYCEANGEQVLTQFDKDDVESIGLVKFDFLGLRTLTIIDWALTTINAKLKSAPIDIANIPLDDKKTFDLLKQCSTTAVFQLESRGMKELIRRLQPDCFDDITALVALFRPGPLQSGMVDDFIDRKHGRAKVHYAHPALESILSPTYGVILYQEQVMQIAQDLAGYTLGGADILRRAMGKKKPEEMAKQRNVFISGAKKQGVDVKVAEYIFDLMEKFAGYGFNKSHSAAYALIAYQTAWLKAHYPAEFMASVLSSDMDNTDKVVSFVYECKSLGLVIRSPNINEGKYHFTVNEQGELIYGLGAIKGVGESLIEGIVLGRQSYGEFTNLFNFCERADARKLSRRALDPLIKSGALDVFNKPRGVLHANIDKALKYADQQRKNKAQGQNDLFNTLSDQQDYSATVEYKTAQAWDDLQRLQGEKDALGVYISGHPLESCKDELKALVKTTINRLQLSTTAVIIAGIILNFRVITTKTGKRMAVMTLEDQTGRVDVTLFSEVYQQAADQIDNSLIFLVKGSVAKDDYTGGIKMIADAVMSLDETRARMARALSIRVAGSDGADQILNQLPKVLAQFGGGRCPIKIVYQSDGTVAELKLGDDWRVKPSSDLMTYLYNLCGRENVSLEYT